ncbi:hypothetical protein DICPUDRAFT_45704 [Dictyostelium purpureum]|uniref:FNIP repeat-containing protein n=1 Tax=Dictyostelium purpureum TaxID=5786 RepID=F0ZBI5_DICPU|nr:uncharacterized protein DICPUDRAFT_45704 [Dictyostelium purpureum]EGC38702.1 hypothetical protein DICPUDRAFT_45704 [Dictyostelium purpureum]|eukprot:XP_003284798.1 hypothetical protein DICPUDRAFT_45704 [Dictyostelium purpureum]
MIIKVLNNNNNNKNESAYNDHLFWKFYRNKIIRIIIFKHIRLFNQHRHMMEMKIDQLMKYEYKDYITSLFIKDNNKNLTKNVIPDSVRELVFFDLFNQPLKPECIPRSIESLTFGDNFNQCIKPFVLPQSIEKLHFGKSFNMPLLPNCLPTENLKHLVLGEDDFNQPIKINSLPSTIEYLSFSTSFNHPVFVDGQSILPHSLTYLNLGGHFNQIIPKNTLPGTLKTIKFGFHYNKPLKKNSLPSSIEHIQFGQLYNQKIKSKRLPTGLKILQFGKNFNQKLAKNVLPSGLDTLVLGENYQQPLERTSLPNKITHLILNGNLNDSSKSCVPNSVTHLTYIGAQKIPSHIKLPESIIHLAFGELYNDTLDELFSRIPSSVKSLSLGYRFNQEFPDFNNDIDQNDINIESLTIGECFNCPINSLPKSIKTLTLKCKYYYHPIKMEALDSITNLYYTNEKIYDVLNLNDLKNHKSSSLKITKLIEN